ncbi:MAG: nicotinate (nicotinamide) nucleotide adenylyltransferase [Anaerolineae bacterium]
MERIGLLGGTFDPPHIGHLILATVAYDALNLTRILFVPAADPPHKQQRRKSPIEVRLAMLERAIAGDSRFGISLVDVNRGGPHYSVDTVRLVQSAFPSSELYFLMGSDSLRDLPSWHEPDRLIQHCWLGVYPRPDAPADLARLTREIPDIVDRVIWVEGPGVLLSASQIRARVRGGLSIRYLVPESVRAYIVSRSLYVTDEV